MGKQKELDKQFEKLTDKAKALIPDVEVSWAKVELYRWQYGELPAENEKPLDEALAVRKMAEAIQNIGKPGNTDPVPSPYSVATVLNYLATKL